MIRRTLTRSPRYLRPAVHCPGCGEAPPVRISMSERDRYARRPDVDTEVQTVQCGQCERIYPLRVRDMGRAA